MQELYKKDLNELDSYDGVVSHPDPNILKCEVKLVLGSTAVNRASWWDVIPVELLKTLKDDAIKCCTQYVSKYGRPSSDHKTEKGQSLSQFPRRLVLKNVQTIRQLHSSPMLVRSCLKSCILGFSITWTKSFQMSTLGLEKDEEPEIKLPTFSRS